MQQTEIAALTIVGILIVLDYVTGLMKSVMQKQSVRRRRIQPHVGHMGAQDLQDPHEHGVTGIPENTM